MDPSVSCEKCESRNMCFAYRKMKETLQDFNEDSLMFSYTGDMTGYEEMITDVSSILAYHCLYYQAQKEDAC